MDAGGAAGPATAAGPDIFPGWKKQPRRDGKKRKKLDIFRRMYDIEVDRFRVPRPGLRRETGGKYRSTRLRKPSGPFMQGEKVRKYSAEQKIFFSVGK